MSVKRSPLSIFYPIVVGSAIVLSCAQRDNRFDPLSPFFKPSLPFLEVSMIVDTTRVIAGIVDSEIVINPPAGINFTAQAHDGDSTKELPVLLKIFRNGELVGVRENVTSFSSRLIDSGKSVFQFETMDQNNRISQKRYYFIIKPDPQPEIISFFTLSDTLKTGVQAECFFSVRVKNQALLLDTMKYISLNKIVTKPVTNAKKDFSDSFTARIFSSDTGVFNLFAIAIDKLGRTDTSETKIVFNTTGKMNNRLKPIIKKINVTTEDSIEYCFNPEVVLFNGDAYNAEYRWTFGNGQYSTDQTPCRWFGKIGLYTIILKVTDETGAFSIDSVIVNVPRSSIPLPKIRSLLINQHHGFGPLNVNFELKVEDTKAVNFITWLFGDGRSIMNSRDFMESTRYLFPGTYYPKVIACNEAGCDSIKDTIVITGLSQIHYFPAGEIVVGQKITFFMENYLPNELSYYWSFPDTTIKTFQNFCEYTFKSTGNFTVQVSAQVLTTPDVSSQKLAETAFFVGKKL